MPKELSKGDMLDKNEIFKKVGLAKSPLDERVYIIDDDQQTELVESATIFWPSKNAWSEAADGTQRLVFYILLKRVIDSPRVSTTAGCVVTTKYGNEEAATITYYGIGHRFTDPSQIMNLKIRC